MIFLRSTLLFLAAFLAAFVSFAPAGEATDCAGPPSGFRLQLVSVEALDAGGDVAAERVRLGATSDFERVSPYTVVTDASVASIDATWRPANGTAVDLERLP